MYHQELEEGFDNVSENLCVYYKVIAVAVEPNEVYLRFFSIMAVASCSRSAASCFSFFANASFSSRSEIVIKN
jgi:hypothetical protein